MSLTSEISAVTPAGRTPSSASRDIFTPLIVFEYEKAGCSASVVVVITTSVSSVISSIVYSLFFVSSSELDVSSLSFTVTFSIVYFEPGLTVKVRESLDVTSLLPVTVPEFLGSNVYDTAYVFSSKFAV